MAQHALDTDAIPESHSARTRVVVTLDHHTLMAGVLAAAHDLPVTGDGLDLPPGVARRLACDAEVIPVLLGAHGEVLDIGRATRTVAVPIWNALVVRDRHCAFPGCHRPPVMCAHHLRHWADLGETELDNLVCFAATTTALSTTRHGRQESTPKTANPNSPHHPDTETRGSGSDIDHGPTECRQSLGFETALARLLNQRHDRRTGGHGGRGHTRSRDGPDWAAMPTFTPLHDDLTFLAPLSEDRAGRLASFLADGHPSSVLDLGCGWAELLLRVLEATPGATGTGIDLDQHALATAREAAERRGVGHRVTLEARDARELHGTFDAVTCIGASQIWGAAAEDNQPLDYVAALTALRELLPRGGRLVYGEGIWSSPPTPEATTPLSGRDDEYVPLGRFVELAESHGYAVMAAHEASLDEWDVFESGFTAGYARWLAEHEPDDPGAEEVRQMAARQHAAYYGGYRGVLGLAYLELIAL